MSRAKERTQEKLKKRQARNKILREPAQKEKDKKSRQSKGSPARMPGFYSIRADERRLWHKYFAAQQLKLSDKRAASKRRQKRKSAQLSRKRNQPSYERHH